MKLAFAEQPFDDLSSQRLQDNVRRATDALGVFPLHKSVSLVVTFSAGQAVRIAHKLQRIPSAWFFTDVTGGYGVFQRTAWDADTITIQSQNACTASFRVL